MRNAHNSRQDHSAYRSCIFFLTSDGEIEPIPHHRYVAVVRREEAMPQLAGQQLRLADWYIEVRDDGSARVENETYEFLEFDAQGFACPTCGHHPDQGKSWQPSAAEREGMRALLDGAD